MKIKNQQHYDCGGELLETNTPGAYRCKRCGQEIRSVVVESHESFVRVAKSDGPAAEIAAAALEGTKHD